MTLHEYIADAHAVKYHDKSHYYQNLLSQVFQTQNISFINPFFKQSLIKKRIVMLQKSKSKQIKLFKYALLIPVVFGMLVYTSCEKAGTELNGTKVDVYKGGSDKKEGNLLEDSIQEGTIQEDIEVPFAFVEHVPTLPECESISGREEQKNCFSNFISTHVQKNFNTKLANELKLTGVQRVNVIFKINKEGNITGVKSISPHPGLEAEAIRVINLLPKMIPGKQKGKNVTVPYSLPIIFKVQDDIP